MAEEIAFENGRISNSEGLVTLTLDWAILHSIVHHSSTSTYMQISLKSKKLFVDGRTFETGFIRSVTLPDLSKSRPKNVLGN